VKGWGIKRKCKLNHFDKEQRTPNSNFIKLPTSANGGDDQGVHTIAFMLPESNQGLLIFTNCDNGTDIYIQIVLSYLGILGQRIIDVETK
jgi:hypothetical protein